MKNLFRSRDFTHLQYNAGFNDTVGFHATHSQDVFMNEHNMRIGVFGGLQKILHSFKATELNGGISVIHDSLPFALKLLYSYRTNAFDKGESTEALPDGSYPSFKTSLMLESLKYWQSCFTRFNAELGVPSTSSAFLKSTFELSTSRTFVDNKLKLSYDLYAGMIKPFTGEKVPLNDRFFLMNEYGFSKLSQEVPASQAACNLLIYHRCFI